MIKKRGARRSATPKQLSAYQRRDSRMSRLVYSWRVMDFRQTDGQAAFVESKGVGSLMPVKNPAQLFFKAQTLSLAWQVVGVYVMQRQSTGERYHQWAWGKTAQVTQAAETGLRSLVESTYNVALASTDAADTILARGIVIAPASGDVGPDRLLPRLQKELGVALDEITEVASAWA